MVVLGILLSADSGQRAADGALPTYNLHIDSQPLGPALQEFARQSGIQVIFYSAIVDGLTAPEVQGRHTRDQALVKLLSRSKLTWRVINPMTVEIRASKAAVESHHVVPWLAVPIVK